MILICLMNGNIFAMTRYHFISFNQLYTLNALCVYDQASFPGLACLSLAVQNSHRRPGLVHHLIDTCHRTSFYVSNNNVAMLPSTCTMELVCTMDSHT